MFLALALLLLFLAGSILMAQRLVRAVLALMGTVVGLAFLYFLLGAQAAGAAQIMIYAGGVLVLLVFGVMTATEANPTRGPISKPIEIFSGFAVAAILFLGMLRVFLPALPADDSLAPLSTYTGGTLASVGTELLLHQAAPFEWAAILLLVALAFAAPFAHKAGEK